MEMLAPEAADMLDRAATHPNPITLAELKAPTAAVTKGVFGADACEGTRSVDAQEVRQGSVRTWHERSCKTLDWITAAKQPCLAQRTESTMRRPSVLWTISRAVFSPMPRWHTSCKTKIHSSRSRSTVPCVKKLINILRVLQLRPTGRLEIDTWSDGDWAGNEDSHVPGKSISLST